MSVAAATAPPSGLLNKIIAHNTNLSRLAIVAMVLPVLIDVTMRTLFHSNLPGSYELEEFIMSVMVVTSLASPQVRGGHISVDLFVRKLSVKHRAALNLFIWTISSVFATLLSCRFFILAVEKFGTAEYSAEWHIPYWPFQFLGSFGAALLTVAVLRDALKALRTMLEERYIAGIVISLGAAALLYSLPFLVPMSPLIDSMPLLGALGMLLMLILILMSVPVGFAMGVIGIIGMITVYGSPSIALPMIGLSAFHTTLTYTYTVVPMFIFMGALAYQSRISEDLFASATTWMGRLPGGLWVSSIGGCAGFSAVCGDSLATAVTMGSVALPEMRKKGYDLGFGCAALAAGGTLGILIPPSIGFIFYAIITEESVARLFIAGVVPGIILTSMFIGIVMVFAIRNPHLAPRGERCSFKEKIVSSKKVIPVFLLLVFVLVGILTGFFTPTEGGAMGAAATLGIALLQRRMNWKRFYDAVDETLSVTARIMLILVGVHLLGFFFANTRLPNELAELTVSLTDNRWIVFSIIVLFYIVFGLIMNIIPLMLLTLPAIYPTVVEFGFDPIWFGVVIVILMEMGQITPPVGVNVFAISSLAKEVPMETIFKNVLPMFLAMLACIILLCFVPGIALWLPGLLM